MHKHRIVPRHMGGTYTPNNVFVCSIAWHAVEHLLLYFQYGCWQDKLAWECLTGLIPSEQAQIEATKRANTGSKYNLGRTQSAETKRKISLANSGRKCPPRTKEYRLKISRANKKRGPMSEEQKHNISLAKLGTKYKSGKILTPEHRAKISASLYAFYFRK